ncbi:MAG: hypothetical protein WCV71_02950 [Patescibacteria group bacterium]|jgi:ABC-type Na+ efflux pump permease subunit
MPIKKINTSSKAKTSSNKNTAKLLSSGEADTLMEFEQFISKKPNKYNRSKSWLALTLIIIIFLLGAVWLFISRTETMEKEFKFKAIYLDNEQTYYAKVVKEDALNIYLDEVYYIQIEKQTIPATEEGAEAQTVDVPVLIKRGQELHRPQGLMQINRSKLVAVEEIGAESQILTEIQRINQ